MIFKNIKNLFITLRNSCGLIFIGIRGISLVELLVSVAMLGGLGLAVGELMRQSGQVTSKNRTRYDESEFLMVLHSKLMQPSVCEKNFPVGADAAVASIASLLDTDNSVLAQVGSTYGENQDLTISAMSSTHDASSSWLKINITFTKAKSTTGPQTISRSLLIFAEVDGAGKIERCLGSALSVEDSAWDLACTNNTTAKGRDVMVTMTDPADATKTLCVRKGLNTEGCGYLDPEMIYEFDYNNTTKLYDATCSAAYKSYLCNSNFLMLVNADGSPYCNKVTQLQMYQPYNTTDDAGAPVSGPPVLNCTGRNYSGFEAHADGIRVTCDGARAGAPTSTPTPTPTNTPTPTPTRAGPSCDTAPWSYTLTITKSDIPDNTTKKYVIESVDNCDVAQAVDISTFVTSCVARSTSGYRNIVACIVTIRNVGGSGGTYTVTSYSVYPDDLNYTFGNQCGGMPTLYSGVMGDSDYVRLRFYAGTWASFATDPTFCKISSSLFPDAANNLQWYTQPTGGYHDSYNPSVYKSSDGGTTFTPMTPD